jgi:hypothetical protein
MPSWVANHDIWEKAKKKAAEEGHAEDWDYITALYKKMGGEIRGDKSLSGIDWTNHPLIVNNPPSIEGGLKSLD